MTNGNGQAKVQVGRPMTFTGEEELWLRDHAITMVLCVENKYPGWRREFVLSLNQINQVIRHSLDRGHNVSDPRQLDLL